MAKYDGLRGNKIIATVLIAGLVSFGVGYLADILYHPETPVSDDQGYAIEANESDVVLASSSDSGIGDISGLLRGADIERGMVVAKKCLACHTFAKGDAHRVGPNMYNIVGASIAAKGDYAYSSALQALQGQNWDYESLNKFLYSPRKYAKGTKMSFAGLKKEKDRANIILYLRSLSDSPIPLP